MKQLRAIRILLAILFLLATIDCLVIRRYIHPMAHAVEELQIALSLNSYAMGVLLVWLLLTLVFGRVYCASVCPVGVMSDIFFRLRKKIPRLNKPFRYRAASKFSTPIFLAYLVCVIVGVMVVPLILEPWNITRNMASVANIQAANNGWVTIGLGAGVGVIAGLVSAVLIALLSVWRGREFCTRYCPIGIGLGMVQQHSLFHIELDPDRCTSCGLCEDTCRSQCIDIKNRIIDQKRCVRCFDCVADCPEEAIRYQIHRNLRPGSPLMNKANPKS